MEIVDESDSSWRFAGSDCMSLMNRKKLSSHRKENESSQMFGDEMSEDKRKNSEKQESHKSFFISFSRLFDHRNHFNHESILVSV